jgi:hypothetical protein
VECLNCSHSIQERRRPGPHQECAV